jgi:hypothetical protein
MTTSRDQALADLRQSIDSLPERTRRAMLTGLGNNTVITGAYSDGGVGVCPMLAAHREGTRARCMGFPEAWDRFTGVHGRYITRPATEYEVLHLRMQLEESLASVATRADFDTYGFAEAIAEHHAAIQAREERSAEEAAEAAAEAARPRRVSVSGGFSVDLGSAIEEHRSTARTRREREATQTGLDWLFEETLVLPEDFDSLPTTEPEHVEHEEFDFSREPAVRPAGHRARPVLK